MNFKFKNTFHNNVNSSQELYNIIGTGNLEDIEVENGMGIFLPINDYLSDRGVEPNDDIGSEIIDLLFD